MAGGRRPGVAPTENHRHRSPDPFVRAGDGWAEITAEPFEGVVPEIPQWVSCGPDARRVYMDLARLPQAVLWGPGTWFELHLTLPLIDRYLARPGSEGFKALVSALGAGLSLTELDLQRARVKVKAPEPVGDVGEMAAGDPKVSDIRDRRKRLTGS